MRFQVTSKLIRPNSWITQTVRQRIPNCWARNGESTSAESAATDARNDELTATGGSQMLATRNRGARVLFLVLVLDTPVLVLEEKSLVVSLFLKYSCTTRTILVLWHLQSRFLRNLLPNTHYMWDFTYLTSKPASKHTLHVRFYLLDIGRNCLWYKFPFHCVLDSLPFRYTFLKFSALT